MYLSINLNTKAMKKISLYLSLLSLLFMFGCNQQGCNQWKQIANELKDTDGDGWLDESNNQKIDLIIESMDLPVQSQFSQISLVVDDRIILDKSPASPTTTISAGTVASSRFAGQWFIGQTQNYRARVKVFLSGETDNKDTTYTQTLNINNKDITFHYRTRITKFADPSPQDSLGDSDRDGITDIEESRLARDDNRIGDPLVRDILVVEGFTNSKWALTKRSIERITTVFLLRGINFLIADEPSDFLGLTPGQILLPDGNNGDLIVPAEGRGVAVAEVPAVRPRHIPALFNPFTHFLIAADNTPDATFGISNGIPGRNVVVRSHFFFLGPDPFGLEYQAKDVMHELGHNFGLCHPNASDNTCPTGPIPQAERNGAASCMGSPADDGGLFTIGPLGVKVPNVTAIRNALSRPLDYSPTQWININPASSRNN
jgi:hypothetical protein